MHRIVLKTDEFDAAGFSFHPNEYVPRLFFFSFFQCSKEQFSSWQSGVCRNSSRDQSCKFHNACVGLRFILFTESAFFRCCCRVLLLVVHQSSSNGCPHFLFSHQSVTGEAFHQCSERERGNLAETDLPKKRAMGARKRTRQRQKSVGNNESVQKRQGERAAKAGEQCIC